MKYYCSEWLGCPYFDEEMYNKHLAENKKLREIMISDYGKEKSNCPLCKGKGIISKSDESNDIEIHGDDL